MENKICQSCGMPITSDEQLGTNKDESINVDYCKYCYYGNCDECKKYHHNKNSRKSLTRCEKLKKKEQKKANRKNKWLCKLHIKRRK